MGSRDYTDLQDGRDYIGHFRILQIFRELTTALLLVRPTSPYQFIIDVVSDIKEQYETGNEFDEAIVRRFVEDAVPAIPDSRPHSAMEDRQSRAAAYIASQNVTSPLRRGRSATPEQTPVSTGSGRRSAEPVLNLKKKERGFAVDATHKPGSRTGNSSPSNYSRLSDRGEAPGPFHGTREPRTEDDDNREVATVTRHSNGSRPGTASSRPGTASSRPGTAGRVHWSQDVDAQSVQSDGQINSVGVSAVRPGSAGIRGRLGGTPREAEYVSAVWADGGDDGDGVEMDDRQAGGEYEEVMDDGEPASFDGAGNDDYDVGVDSVGVAAIRKGSAGLRANYGPRGHEAAYDVVVADEGDEDGDVIVVDRSRG